MKGYLGEFDVDLAKTKYWLWGKEEWAIFWIGMYGQIDGDHHKLWVIDQVMRILQGTKVIVSEARWENGHKEYRFVLTDSPSKVYENFVDQYEKEDDWDTGIAP